MLCIVSLSDLNAAQMNVQLSLIQKLLFYEFEMGHNVMEVTKNIFCEEYKSTIDHRIAARGIKKSCKNHGNQAKVGLKPWILRPMLKAIEANSESGKLGISHFIVVQQKLNGKIIYKKEKWKLYNCYDNIFFTYYTAFCREEFPHEAVTYQWHRPYPQWLERWSARNIPFRPHWPPARERAQAPDTRIAGHPCSLCSGLQGSPCHMRWWFLPQRRRKQIHSCTCSASTLGDGVEPNLGVWLLSHGSRAEVGAVAGLQYSSGEGHMGIGPSSHPCYPEREEKKEHFSNK